MCIAVPVKIVAIVDPARARVQVEAQGHLEEVNAGLVCTTPDEVAALLGRWVVLHVGYVMQVLDDRDAQSRLAMFAAMDGLPVADEELRPY